MKNTFDLNRYQFGVGRRKTSTARVYLEEGNGKIIVNGLPFEEYFYGNISFFSVVIQPLKLLDKQNSYNIKATIRGGGFTGQVEAMRLGIARALLKIYPDCRTTLKSFSLLTRDARVKERKKYGLKAARKAPQFSKR
jgi:small subunit ribosomal protein S9